MIKVVGINNGEKERVNADNTKEINIIIGDGSSIIIDGTSGESAGLSYAGTFTGWRVSEVSGVTTGSIEVDIKINGSVVSGTEPVELITQQDNSDLALSTWTTSLSVGDKLGFEVISNTDCKYVHIVLEVAL